MIKSSVVGAHGDPWRTCDLVVQKKVWEIDLTRKKRPEEMVGSHFISLIDYQQATTALAKATKVTRNWTLLSTASTKGP